MDRVIVAIGSGADEQTVRRIVKDVGFELPLADFGSDPETMDGIRQAGLAFGFAEMLFLVMNPNDDSSNQVTQETFESVVINETASRLEKLVEHIGRAKLESDIWLCFAYGWTVDQEIVYYEGDSAAFRCHLTLNGGAFRTTYSLVAGSANIDLDTPVIWRVRSAR